MVVWIIGLSGAGKTTLAEEVASIVRRRGGKVALLDGDRIRELFGNDLGHDIEDRRRNAERICRLCKFLDEQGIDVVCAILSLFPESRAWCRENIGAYFEVFIDAPVDDLVERDSKGIYGRYKRGEVRDVAGFDLEFIPPEVPDLHIKNVDSRQALLDFAPAIADRICPEAA